MKRSSLQLLNCQRKTPTPIGIRIISLPALVMVWKKWSRSGERLARMARYTNSSPGRSWWWAAGRAIPTKRRRLSRAKKRGRGIQGSDRDPTRGRAGGCGISPGGIPRKSDYPIPLLDSQVYQSRKALSSCLSLTPSLGCGHSSTRCAPELTENGGHDAPSIATGG